MENKKKNFTSSHKFIKNALNINLSAKVYPDIEKISPDSSSTNHIPEEKDYFVKQNKGQSQNFKQMTQAKTEEKNNKSENDENTEELYNFSVFFTGFLLFF